MTQRKIRNFDFTESSVTPWILLDYRFEDGFERSVFGAVTTGDSLLVETAGSVEASPSIVQTIKTYTSLTFDDVITGPLAMVRFSKQGAGANTRVTFVG